MTTPRFRLLLVIALSWASAGCASTGRYPFREKPTPKVEAAEPRPDGDLAEVQREVGMYSD